MLNQMLPNNDQSQRSKAASLPKYPLRGKERERERGKKRIYTDKKDLACQCFNHINDILSQLDSTCTNSLLNLLCMKL